MDHIEVANKKSLEEFVKSYFPSTSWKTWTHPTTKAAYDLSMQTASTLPPSDFTACFNLIESTSSKDYQKSKDGWKPRAKKREMKLLDLKYLVVKRDGKVEGFVSFMPTEEDDHPVVYCYEIHLGEELRGSGLGATLMQYLLTIAQAIPSTAKVMLTVFTRNERAVSFYNKLGYTKDEFSPPPRILRNGTKVEAEYVIMSKAIR
ncbi:acyl-CoA N-acyltransferase [Rhexocercosporidium sp. MPI-PUGE-AT-0058]|nr:acyl-CoA N-acyltransferase [Rhexocercosporidium sp. MPI-PUGE-AT-0058]